MMFFIGVILVMFASILHLVNFRSSWYGDYLDPFASDTVVLLEFGSFILGLISMIAGFLQFML